MGGVLFGHLPITGDELMIKLFDEFLQKHKFLLCILVFCISIVVNIVYIFVCIDKDFGEAHAESLLVAYQCIQNKTLILKDFNYIHYYPVTGYLLFLPIVLIFGKTYIAYKIGTLIYLALFTLAIYWFFKIGLDYTIDKAFLYTGIVRFLILSSAKTRLLFIGNTYMIYNFALASILLCFALYFSKRYKLLGVLLFLIGLDGIDCIILAVFPFIFSIFIYDYIIRGLKVNKKLVFYNILMYICGFGCHFILRLGTTTSAYRNSFLHLQETQNWVWSIDEKLVEYISFATGNITTEISLISIKAITVGFMLIFGSITFIIPYICLKYKDKVRIHQRNIFVLFSIISSFTIYVFMSLTDFKSTPTGYNLRPGSLYIYSIICLIIFINIIDNKRLKQSFVFLIIFACIVATYNSLIDKVESGDRNYKDVVAFCKENNLTKGYAVVPYASAVEIMSNDTINLAGVTTDGEQRYYYNYTSDYNDIDRNFLFCNNDNLDNMLELNKDAEVIPYNGKYSFIIMDKIKLPSGDKK